MIDSKRKAIIFLTISFLLALVAAGVILVQINQAQEKLGKTVAVAAVKKDVKSYYELTKKDIEWIQLPSESAQKGFITDEKDLDDVITVVNLEKGDLLTRNLVRKKLDIPENERVVWLNATEIVLVDQKNIAPGDLVDIIVTTGKEDKMQTKRIFQNVYVVEVEEVDEEPPRVRISVPIEDAESLIHYQNSAKQIRVLRVNQAASGKQELKEAAESQSTAVPEQNKPADGVGKAGATTNTGQQKTPAQQKPAAKPADKPASTEQSKP
jgi:Flp pilus assembly protein CpaB